MIKGPQFPKKVKFYSILLKFYSILLNFTQIILNFTQILLNFTQILTTFFIIDVSRCWKMELSCASWSTRSPQELCPNLNKPARHFFSWKMFNLFSKLSKSMVWPMRKFSKPRICLKLVTFHRYILTYMLNNKSFLNDVENLS